jgi:maltooligosyltrehalose trehalohydrolase
MDEYYPDGTMTGSSPTASKPSSDDGSRPMFARRLPIGAEVQADGVHFRVWAPRRQRVEVIFEGQQSDGVSKPPVVELQPEGNGYFSGLAKAASAGMLYRYQLDGEAQFPDPASRFQPLGPHGPSQVVDPAPIAWTDQEWRGVPARGQVLYEMHIGTFTQEGTWQAAARELPELARAGITVLEVMPVADFPGRFGWGYDGVNLFAPTRLYGPPDDFRNFVNQAHAAGLGVILDVVYNHLGPDGNYLSQFSENYVTDRYDNEWGEALNFDGDNSQPVREFFLANAGYWIDEYHLDGLRLDATQQIFDASPEHILAAISRRVRQAAGKRATFLVAENEAQESRLVRPLDQGGFGLDAVWNDDFHHSAMVALTGRSDAYYTDYRGTAQEFVAACKWGFLYQGQWYSWQKKRRGTPTLDLPPTAFVAFLQNHDQVANSARGQRCHELSSPSRHRAITALLLLAPATPMLFQGQEFAATSPFFYFADHKEELAHVVAEGRVTFLSQFRTLATPEMQARLPHPSDPMTFTRCKLDLSERRQHAAEYALHMDLLRLRREDPVLSGQRARRGIDGAVLAEAAFVLRFFGEDHGNDRLLVVNLGREVRFQPAPEPLLAPPDHALWEIAWSSEDPRYGGVTTPPLETPEFNWHIQGEAAVLLRPRPRDEERSAITTMLNA